MSFFFLSIDGFQTKYILPPTVFDYIPRPACSGSEQTYSCETEQLSSSFLVFFYLLFYSYIFWKPSAGLGSSKPPELKSLCWVLACEMLLTSFTVFFPSPFNRQLRNLCAPEARRQCCIQSRQSNTYISLLSDKPRQHTADEMKTCF